MSVDRREFRFLDPLRVRWVEVDLQKIVFNGHYLMYFDTAVAGYWRDMALPYHDTMLRLEGDLFVRKATVEYESSARYDESLRVGVRTQRIGNSSLLLRCAVFKAAKVLVHGELVYVFADPHTQTSRPVPETLRDALRSYEAGDAMTSARIGAWETMSAEVTLLRRGLAAPEMASLSSDLAGCHDVAATHVVLVNRLAQTVAAARVWSGEHPDEWRLDGLTIHPALRGAGLVADLLRTAKDAARNEGATTIVAQAPAGLAATMQGLGFACEATIDATLQRFRCSV